MAFWISPKALRPERHVIADVTTRQMLDEWNRLHPGNPRKPEPASVQASAGGGDALYNTISELYKGSPTRKTVGGILCRAMLSRVIEKGEGPTEKRAVIRDFRNRYLADRFENYSGDRIYITYGAAHLPGVIELLIESGPDWKVTSTKWVRALKAPEHYEGEMQFE